MTTGIKTDRKTDASMSKSSRAGAFLLLCLLIWGSYSNSYHAGWHFDDLPNILNNAGLHIRNLRPETLAATLYSNPKNPYESAKKMYRPVPCLTFALNWYIGKDDPFGYHVVNIGLHILTSFLLYLFIQALYTSPRLRQASLKEKQLVPILATLLWALNPIHTQAVTYIVQRMAVLAAFFYLLGLYLFIRARLAKELRTRLAGYGACLLCYVLAIGSKENTIVLPISLVLIEFAFFQDLHRKKIKYAFMGLFALSVISLLVFGILLFLRGNAFAIVRGYDFRPFSMSQRLLTEMRVVVYYITQIFYPVPGRLSIAHDVPISTSLLHPWTTLPAGIFLLSLAATGAASLAKYPLVGFSLLFFLINHVIESSIIPLELIFEHRNYLPSFFMFIPVALGLQRVLDHYDRHDSRNVLRFVFCCFAVFLVIGYGMSTFIRNRVWATEKSLWEDAAIKAPMSARPLTNLAWDMAYGENAHPQHYDNALVLYKRSLDLYQPSKGMNSSILNNMAGLQYKKGQYDAAVELLRTSLRLKPSNTKSRYDLASVYVTLGKWNDAEKTMASLVSGPKVHEGYLNQQALILLHQHRALEAVTLLKRSFEMAPRFWRTLVYSGVAFNELGYHDKAEWFLNRGKALAGDNPLPLFCLIDNALKAGKPSGAREYLEQLFMSFSAKAIHVFVERLRHDNHLPPISYPMVSEAVIHFTDTQK